MNASFEAVGTGTSEITLDGDCFNTNNTTNYWRMKSNGTFNIDYVKVQDSENTGAINIEPSNYVDLGHNIKWGAAGELERA